MHDQDTSDLSFIKDQNKVQTKIAYRQVALFFQRAYTNHTSTKFKFWKEKVRTQIHKEKVKKKSGRSKEEPKSSKNVMKFEENPFVLEVTWG